MTLNRIAFLLKVKNYMESSVVSTSEVASKETLESDRKEVLEDSQKHESDKKDKDESQKVKLSLADRIVSGINSFVDNPLSLVNLIVSISQAVFVTILAGLCFGQSKVLNRASIAMWSNVVDRAHLSALSVLGIFDWSQWLLKAQVFAKIVERNLFQHNYTKNNANMAELVISRFTYISHLVSNLSFLATDLSHLSISVLGYAVNRNSEFSETIFKKEAQLLVLNCKRAFAEFLSIFTLKRMVN